MNRASSQTTSRVGNSFAGYLDGPVQVVRTLRDKYLPTKIRISMLFILLLTALYVDAQEIFTPEIMPNTAFADGEILTYQIRYGFVVGGTTTLSITNAAGIIR